MTLRLIIAALAAAGALAASSETAAKDIVQAAQEAGQFTMLLKAVKQAGLEAKMKTPGPFTVFAPTDAAFRALPPDVAKRLMNPANKKELAMVLSYHVLAGRLMTSDVRGKTVGVDTLVGKPLVVNAMGPGLKVNDANIVSPDMRVDNGVVHVIDRVLLPPMAFQPRM